MTVRPVNILVDEVGVVFDRGELDSTVSYDGANVGNEYQIIEGAPLSLLTATKRLVPTKRSAVTATGGATSAVVPVLNAQYFKAGDVVTVGTNVNQTIASVNYANNQITLAASITFLNNDPVFGAGTTAGGTNLGGSDIPMCFLCELVDMRVPPFGWIANPST